MMPPDEKTSNDLVPRPVSCTYRPPHDLVGNFHADANDCLCSPPISQGTCHCSGLSNRWAKESFEKRKRHPRQRGLIAYLRTNGDGQGIEQQRKVISDYCHDNEYYVKATFVDQGKPSVGLKDAMKAVDDADGLIAADLNRFVEHSSDRFRDLRPFVHHFFCHAAKHLITVEEGVDTGSCAGQANVVELMNQVKEHS